MSNPIVVRLQFQYGPVGTTWRYSPVWDEYVVKTYVNGEHQPAADYFTSDRNDAEDTAKKIVIDYKVFQDRVGWE